MIVEDEFITARYLKGIISKLGHVVIGTFDNAHDTMAALEGEHPDMIMMDINIKGKMDGLELTSIVAQRYQIPVVFITAYCDSETLSRAMKLSPYGYIVKPFSEVDINIALKLAYQRYQDNHHRLKSAKLNKVKLSGDCWFDLETSTSICNGKSVNLNAKQLALLQLLIKHKNSSVSQETIEQSLWRDRAVSSSSVRTLVYSIRKAIPDIIIETHSKIGYILKTLP